MENASDKFVVHDTGNKKQFATGMVRNSNADKVRYNQCLVGPMFKRWASHTFKGAKIYPDIAPGVPNWTLAETKEELARATESFFGHVVDYLDGKEDEDHAAAIFFNINLMENIKEKLRAKKHTEQVDSIADLIMSDPKNRETIKKLSHELKDKTAWKQAAPPSHPHSQEYFYSKPLFVCVGYN